MIAGIAVLILWLAIFAFIIGGIVAVLRDS